MVRIDDKALEKMVNEVAPLVEDLTGWDTKLDSLNIKTITRDEYWKYGQKPLHDYLGDDKRCKTWKDTLTSYFVAASYVHPTETILMIGNNKGVFTNESALKVVIGHELVHRCQFVNNPVFEEIYFSLAKKLRDDAGYDEFGAANLRFFEKYAMLAEGDATFVEDQLLDKHYWNAKETPCLLHYAGRAVLGLYIPSERRSLPR